MPPPKASGGACGSHLDDIEIAASAVAAGTPMQAAERRSSARHGLDPDLLRKPTTYLQQIGQRKTLQSNRETTKTICISNEDIPKAPYGPKPKLPLVYLHKIILIPDQILCRPYFPRKTCSAQVPSSCADKSVSPSCYWGPHLFFFLMVSECKFHRNTSVSQNKHSVDIFGCHLYAHRGSIVVSEACGMCPEFLTPSECRIRPHFCFFILKLPSVYVFFFSRVSQHR